MRNGTSALAALGSFDQTQLLMRELDLVQTLQFQMMGVWGQECRIILRNPVWI